MSKRSRSAYLKSANAEPAPPPQTTSTAPAENRADQQRLKDAASRFATLLRMPSTGIAAIFAELSSPAAPLSLLRRHGVALDVEGPPGTKSLMALTEEGIEVAKWATKCADGIVESVLQHLRERRAQAFAKQEMGSFFPLCEAEFSPVEIRALKDCAEAFEEVIPLTRPLEAGLHTAEDMKDKILAVIHARAGETERRRLHKLATSLRGSETEVAIGLAKALPGFGTSISLSLWPVQSVQQHHVALHLKTVTGVHVQNGLLINSLARRETLRQVLVALSSDEGYPPFLRSCRRSTEAGLTWTSDAILPTLESVAFNSIELPVAAFGVPAHRAADLSRELSDVFDRYVSLHLWFGSRPAIVSLLHGATPDIEAIEVPIVKASAEYSAALTQIIRREALKSSTSRGEKAFGVLFGKKRAVPLLSIDERAGHGVELQEVSVQPDFVAAIIVVQVDNS